MNGNVMIAGAILVLAGIKDSSKEITHLAVLIFGVLIIIISFWM